MPLDWPGRIGPGLAFWGAGVLGSDRYFSGNYFRNLCHESFNCLKMHNDARWEMTGHRELYDEASCHVLVARVDDHESYPDTYSDLQSPGDLTSVRRSDQHPIRGELGGTFRTPEQRVPVCRGLQGFADNLQRASV